MPVRFKSVRCAPSLATKSSMSHELWNKLPTDLSFVEQVSRIV